MENERINIKCPKCSQVLAVQKPSKPGMYQLTCSKCSHQFKLQLRGVPIKMEDKKPEEQKPENRRKVKVLGEPKPTSDGKYRIAEPAIIGHPYGCICPECKKAVVFLPQQAGAQAIRCNKCSTMIIFKAFANEEEASASAVKKTAVKEEPKDDGTEASSTIRANTKNNRSMGMLSWGNIFSRKKHILSEGNTIIGRKDPDYPSDIEFNDNKMSRRSVTINVTQKDNGWFFRLTVNKATNPVYVNSSELAEGESVYLKYGAIIQLGKTIVNFQKVE